MRSLFGGFIDPTATFYGGVTMRSRLEADFAAHLDAMGVRWTYEPRIFGPEGSGYLPDFEVARGDGRPCYIEVKPRRADVRGAARRMEVVWADEPTALLIVACAEGCTFSAALAGGRWTSWVERWRHG